MEPINVKDIKIPHHRLYSRLNGLVLEGFSASMQQDGQLEPIIVFRDAEDTLWLGDGYHRLKELQNKAQKFPEETPQTILALVRGGSEEDAVIFSVRANVHRGKLNPGNLAETLNYFYRKGWNTMKLCREFHLSKGYVAKLLSIANSDPNILSKLTAGEITSNEAYRASKIGMDNFQQEQKTCAFCGDRIRPDNLYWKPYHGECALKVSLLIQRDQMNKRPAANSRSSADDKEKSQSGGEKAEAA
jgi:ParB-like chromosome segregation protein Spo0J